ncbi:MAG: class I SAM-dependent methyltransferase [Candidatus Paceibacterota bacterium]
MYEKNRYYRRHADRIKKWIEEKNTLDVGAGDGKITHLLGIKGVDNELEAVKLAVEKGADVVLGDAYQLPYKNEEFDSVLMVNVVEHFKYPQKAIQEARRVLKKYIYVVTPPKDLVPGKMDRFHYQEWTSEELKELVEKEGFLLEGKILIIPEEKCMYAKFKKI